MNVFLSVKKTALRTLSCILTLSFCTVAGIDLSVNLPIVVLKFDTEDGSYDARKITAKQHKEYLALWKRLRTMSQCLNPDKEHGRECNTYPYLHARNILVSKYFPTFVFFFVNPGWRPCDFDERCVPQKEVVQCIHTSGNHPIPISLNGTTLKDFLPSLEYFDSLAYLSQVKVNGSNEAKDLFHIWRYLMGDRSGTPSSFVKENPEDTSWTMKATPLPFEHGGLYRVRKDETIREEMR
jgi:hypothetical protein